MFERSFIESFLKIEENKERYTGEERKNIAKDLEVIDKFSFDEKEPNSELLYVGTAGGPGAAKSTTLETFLQQHDLEKQLVYVDPDAVALKNMIYTYRSFLRYFDFAQASSNHETLRNAYEKWRYASTYIAHEMLQKVFGGDDDKKEKRYSVAHGTTATHPSIGTFYQKVKDRGYRITLLLCYSEDTTRQQQIERREREQGFVQSDLNDVIEKGRMFPQRFKDYFNYGDEVFFYWNDALTHGTLPAPCAQYVKENNALRIIREEDWKSFCKKYLDDIKTLGCSICETLEPWIPPSLLDKKDTSALVDSRHNVWSNIGDSSTSNEAQKIDGLWPR